MCRNNLPDKNRISPLRMHRYMMKTSDVLSLLRKGASRMRVSWAVRSELCCACIWFDGSPV